MSVRFFQKESDPTVFIEFSGLNTGKDTVVREATVEDYAVHSGAYFEFKNPVKTTEQLASETEQAVKDSPAFGP